MPKPGPRTTNRYSDRFKATAVKLSELPGIVVQDVAEYCVDPLHSDPRGSLEHAPNGERRVQSAPNAT